MTANRYGVSLGDENIVELQSSDSVLETTGLYTFEELILLHVNYVLIKNFFRYKALFLALKWDTEMLPPSPGTHQTNVLLTI